MMENLAFQANLDFIFDRTQSYREPSLVWGPECSLMGGKGSIKPPEAAPPPVMGESLWFALTTLPTPCGLLHPSPGPLCHGPRCLHAVLRPSCP